MKKKIILNILHTISIVAWIICMIIGICGGEEKPMWISLSMMLALYIIKENVK